MWKVSPCLLAAVALLHPGEAAASTYTVNPTRVYLNASTGSALVTLKNESAEPLRMQVKAQRWAQSLDGEIQLSATEDLIVFPALLTLKPGEERKIRVATSVAFGPVEKTYRLYVEELPPTTTEKADGASVRILTRMGVPVFLQPAKPQAAALIRDAGSVEWPPDVSARQHAATAISCRPRSPSVGSRPTAPRSPTGPSTGGTCWPAPRAPSRWPWTSRRASASAACWSKSRSARRCSRAR